MASTPTEERKNSLAMQDPAIITRLRLIHNMGQDIEGLKSQILEFERTGKDLDLIRKYLDDRAKQIYGELQKAKKRFDQARTPKGKGSSETNAIHDPNVTEDGKVPYFKMIPPIPAYEMMEIYLVLLHGILSKARDPSQRDTHPYWFNPVYLEKFLDELSEKYTANLPNFSMLIDARMDYFKKQLDTGLKPEEIDRDGWLEDIPDKVIKEDYLISRKNVRIAMQEQLMFLNLFRFVEVFTPSYSNMENLGKIGDKQIEKIERDKDTIALMRKGWIFLQWYQYCAEQRDQRSAYGFFLQLALDKNATW